MSATMVDSYIPHRKPLPNPILQPVRTDQLQTAHSRTRTVSSSPFPPAPTGFPPCASPPRPAPQQNMYPYGSASGTRRTLSNATASTTSTTASNSGVARSGSGLRRSSSARSGNTPASYVALMRKQKATVWCERAQQEDPRLVAQQRSAKMKAAIDLAGGPSTGRTSTSSSGVRAKIRHHGAPKALPYTPLIHGKGGLPARMISGEAYESDSDGGDSSFALGGGHHHRTGSGRSSTGSGRRASSYAQAGGRFSAHSTPPSWKGSSPSETVNELAPEPAAAAGGGPPREFFQAARGTGLSSGSGSSGEREFGSLGEMQEQPKREEKSTKDDLVRRGSVDERTTTMTGNVRLFVANPDLSD